MNSQFAVSPGQVKSTIVRAKSKPLPRSRLVASGALKVLGMVSPELAAGVAFRLWFRTGRRLPVPPDAAGLLAKSDPLLLWHGDDALRGFAWGDGPPVLLVHGWGGDSSQWAGFVAPLVEAGHRVLAYDLPAHGRNRGRRTNVFRAAAALRAVGQEHGPMHAVVTHSFGTLASLVAVRRGLLLERMIAIAPTVLPETVVRGFADALRLSPPVRNRLAGRVLEFAGPGFWDDLSQPHPALIIHDDHDRLAPVANAKALASSWPDARTTITSGLGHYRVLRDPGVIADVTGFIAARTANL